MAAKLIQSTEAIEVNQLITTIYGQPSARKTSMAQTAENPITFAFDERGLARAFGRKTGAMFDNWPDVASFDATGYKTIIIDTIGMCLEKLAASIIADTPKNGNRNGGLTLQGYGVLKAQFAAWTAGIRQRGQDIVFIAHEKAEKIGDDSYYAPDIVGGSYGTVMNLCDLVGYAHFENGHHVVDFQPTDRWMAKMPPCGIGRVKTPDFAAEPKFLANLIAQAKASMGQISAASAEIAAVVDDWKGWLAAEPDLDALNARLSQLSDLGKHEKTQVWSLIQEYAATWRLTFDKKSKTFTQEA